MLVFVYLSRCFSMRVRIRKSKPLQVRVPRLLLRESPCTSEPQCLSDDPTRAESYLWAEVREGLET